MQGIHSKHPCAFLIELIIENKFVQSQRNPFMFLALNPLIKVTVLLFKMSTEYGLIYFLYIICAFFMLATNRTRLGDVPVFEKRSSRPKHLSFSRSQVGSSSGALILQIMFPPPASSNAACAFNALRLPNDFLFKL